MQTEVGGSLPPTEWLSRVGFNMAVFETCNSFELQTLLTKGKEKLMFHFTKTFCHHFIQKFTYNAWCQRIKNHKWQSLTSARRILCKRIALKQTRTLCVWQTEMLPMNKYTDQPGPAKSSEYRSGINVVDPEPSSDTVTYKDRKPTFRSKTG